MTGRLLVSLLGGLVLACGIGLAWALHFPSTRTNNIFFGGILIPLAWIAAMLWLWFSSWKQLWRRLLASALILYAAIVVAYRFG
ncbi:hypothetical protein F2P45_18295 [Massilia sp. CCM 8733]|uniref:Transmembrane protein n=1 Tax=Massilia mucilaginosa TaxID=2609282 RepID=A0ABX0NVH8_9BURK|nr:hypothetical protein [Massilia mucilaginosa]NHZ90954.1 hypothetical protein [Massilia mucilaginosa]